MFHNKTLVTFAHHRFSFGGWCGFSSALDFYFRTPVRAHGMGAAFCRTLPRSATHRLLRSIQQATSRQPLMVFHFSHPVDALAAAVASGEPPDRSALKPPAALLPARRWWCGFRYLRHVFITRTPYIVDRVAGLPSSSLPTTQPGSGGASASRALCSLKIER